MGNAARGLAPRIPDGDPVLLAAMRAPVEEMPETEQERLELEEARALGRFVPGPEVSEAIASRSAR
jgi:hypothetical protein